MINNAYEITFEHSESCDVEFIKKKFHKSLFRSFYLFVTTIYEVRNNVGKEVKVTLWQNPCFIENVKLFTLFILFHTTNKPEHERQILNVFIFLVHFPKSKVYKILPHLKMAMFVTLTFLGKGKV